MSEGLSITASGARSEETLIISSPLLRLPREIRDTILRLLLLCRWPIIATDYCRCGLGPEVLRVNRQLYNEGLDVLYGENHFHMRIFSKHGEHAYFLYWNHFAEEVEFSMPLYKRIQHYIIYVEMQPWEDCHIMESAIGKVAKVLSGVPRLKHLRIEFGPYDKYYGPPVEELYEYSHVLEPFTLLRNVHRVDVIGVRPRYGQYLKDIMEGHSPVNHLPKMYDAREHLEGSFNEYEIDHQRACDAMADDDVNDFKRIRAELVQRVPRRTENALNQLFDHDAEEESVTERRGRTRKKSHVRRWTQ